MRIVRAPGAERSPVGNTTAVKVRLDRGAANGLSFGLKPPLDDRDVRVHWARGTGR